MRRVLGPIALTALALLSGCTSEDPRLPERLYRDALKLSQDGKVLEAKLYMDQIAARFPDHPMGQQAQKDAYLMEAFHRQDTTERVRAMRGAMRRIADALKRYNAKKGEFPTRLQELVPEYLEQVPLTPWSHPYLYRPFVSMPMEEVTDRRGRISQRFNTKLDRFNLVCLGVDGQPGGKDLAADTFVIDGEFVQDRAPRPVPDGQPVR